MVRVGSLVDQMILDKNLRENKTEMTADSEIGRNANDVFTAPASDTTVKESENLLPDSGSTGRDGKYPRGK